MTTLITTVDDYLSQGCGRCPRFATPQCKVHDWQPTLVALREILQATALDETIKWGQPCYTVSGGNVLILAAFKAYCALNFFKGTLLSDPQQQLVTPGPNSQAVRSLRFTSPEQVRAATPLIRATIAEAIALELAGATVEFSATAEADYPDELRSRFATDPEFAAAFLALTPGRRRGYALHFAAPKRSQTRQSRIESCRPQILLGKGLHDR